MMDRKTRRPRKGEVIGGRIYGLKNLNVVVRQSPGGMIVESRHSTIEAAKRQAGRLAATAEDAVYAGLKLIGNPRRDYKPGDFVLADDIVWDRTSDHCSECCRNCMPDTLEYRCPLTRGNPLCDTVKASRVESAGYRDAPIRLMVLPCPCCGEREQLSIGVLYAMQYGVRCGGCGLEIAEEIRDEPGLEMDALYVVTLKRAVAKWNRRTDAGIALARILIDAMEDLKKPERVSCREGVKAAIEFLIR